MDIELILQKFAVFSGLTGEELQACLPYCRDAMEQLTAKRRPSPRRSPWAVPRQRWPTTAGAWRR